MAGNSAYVILPNKKKMWIVDAWDAAARSGGALGYLKHSTYNKTDGHGKPWSKKQKKALARTQGNSLRANGPPRPGHGSGGSAQFGGTGRNQRGDGPDTSAPGSSWRGTYEHRGKGPFVCCMGKDCKGHSGRQSFKYICDIGKKPNSEHCIACGYSWWSSIMDYCRQWGPIPGTKLGEEQATIPPPSPFSEKVVQHTEGGGGSASNGTFGPTAGPSPFCFPKQFFDVCP